MTACPQPTTAYHFRFPDGLINFGDTLNELLLPRLFPRLRMDAAGEDCPQVLVGIGTLINAATVERLARFDHKLVFSTGYGYLEGRAVTLAADWEVGCLRGPLSAKALGLAPAMAITDGAMLAARHLPQPGERARQPAFMPHITTARFGERFWPSLCSELGLAYLDPRAPVEANLAGVAQAAYLITEAMHGAILADAYRTPWMAVTICDVLRFKWQDWCSSLGLTYAPTVLPPVWPDRATGPLAKAKLAFRRAQIARIIRGLMREQRLSLSDDRLLGERLDQLEACAAVLAQRMV